VTAPLLSQAVTVAGALLALWVYVRLGARRPASLTHVMVHVGVAIVVVTVLHGTVDFESAGNSGRGTAVLFGFFLPAMTYAFLSALYLLEQLHKSLSLR
jgi:hypothetical protein